MGANVCINVTGSPCTLAHVGRPWKRIGRNEQPNREQAAAEVSVVLVWSQNAY